MSQDGIYELLEKYCDAEVRRRGVARLTHPRLTVGAGARRLRAHPAAPACRHPFFLLFWLQVKDYVERHMKLRYQVGASQGVSCWDARALGAPGWFTFGLLIKAAA